MSKLRFILLLLAIFILQTVFLPRFNLWGITADLFFVTVVIVVVLRGGAAGAAYGLWLGLWQDLLSSNYYVHTIGLVLFAFIIFFARKSFVGNKFWVAALLVLLASPLYNLSLYAVLVYGYGLTYPVGQIFILTLLVTVLNVLSCLLLFPLLYNSLISPDFKIKKKDVITYL